MTIENRELRLYAQEWTETLEQLRQKAPALHELAYFFQTAAAHFSFEKLASRKPKAIVLGSSFPEELIYASGAAPYWILGGSLETAAWADHLTPRDTDPVSRSILGFLQNDFMNLAENALILIPLINDSSRKLAGLLRQAGRKVQTVDFPPVKDAAAIRQWERQMETCADALSRHTGRRITRRSLQRAAKMVASAKIQMRRFLKLADSRADLLPGSLRMFILYSYFCTENLVEWTWGLEQLNGRLTGCETSVRRPGKSSVLLMGSPVYFPDYKIPLLLEETGFQIRCQADYATQRIFTPQTPSRGISGRLNAFYLRDCSSAYPQNDTLFQSVSRLLSENPVDGVVYHVLKGQIEYDFELERFEKLFARWDVPVFRLETDYNRQDVEQLRIRMEAFLEMLVQKRFQKDGRAA